MAHLKNLKGGIRMSDYLLEEEQATHFTNDASTNPGDSQTSQRKNGLEALTVRRYEKSEVNRLERRLQISYAKEKGRIFGYEKGIQDVYTAAIRHMLEQGMSQKAIDRYIDDIRIELPIVMARLEDDRCPDCPDFHSLLYELTPEEKRYFSMTDITEDEIHRIIQEHNLDIPKTHAILDVLERDRNAHYSYESHMKWVRDEMQTMSCMKESGWESGLEEGTLEAKTTLVHRMMELDESPETIYHCVDASSTEVDEILDRLRRFPNSYKNYHPRFHPRR
jgi:hypothetical protein